MYLITYAYTSTVSEPNIIEIPKIFENAEIIRISDNAITAPGIAYVKDTISLKKNIVLLLYVFLKNWNKIAIIIIIKDEIKAKKNELNERIDNSFKSILLNVSIAFFII